MLYYKNPETGEVFAYNSNEERESWGHFNLVKITEEEVKTILNHGQDIPPEKQFTSLEFLDLFTEEEQLSIATAAMQSPQVKLWYDRTLAASFVTLSDQRTEAGLDALVSYNLLPEQRKTEIVQAMQE